MKKFLTIALCLAATGSMVAQKSVVEQAKKLGGKDLNQARELINQAMQNPETANNVDTYYIAGKIEMDAFKKGRDKLKINPQDASVNIIDLYNSLRSGFQYYMQALPLDSLPNEKGVVKPVRSKDIVKTLNENYDQYFSAGVEYYNQKMNYPQAFEAFMLYGDFPGWEHATVVIPDSVRAMSYFNAGLSAYSGNAVPQAAEAFRRARLFNYSEPEAYTYEIACWQNMMMNDSTLADAGKQRIYEIAIDGNNKFGVSQPIFISNVVNTLVIDDKFDDALAVVTDAINNNPDKSALYGLRGFVYDRMGNDDASLADYRKAATMEDVNYETLKNVSKKLFKVGTQILSTLEGVSPEVLAKKKEIRDDYFKTALDVANRARKMNASDSDLDYVLDSIEYALETYFTNVPQ